jgi:DNA polymerase-3 subunit delta
MKVANNQIDNYIKQSLANNSSALLYGVDEGVIYERKQDVIKAVLGEDFDDLHLVEYQFKDISDSFHNVIDEANGFSLIPGRKLLIIYAAKDAIAEDLQIYFDMLKSDSFLLVVADDLKPTGKLRKFYEAEQNIVSIPCYIDDEQSLKNIIISDLKHDGYQISYDLADFIASKFYGNRQILRSELLKLKNFMGDNKEVSFEDVESIITGSKEKNLQDFANKIANLEIANLANIIEANKKIGVNSITLCRVLINYFTRLNLAASYRAQDMTNNDAVSKLRPPVFFKQKSLMIQHLSKWSNAKIYDFLTKVQQYELLLKKNSSGEFTDILFADFLVKYLARV